MTIIPDPLPFFQCRLFINRSVFDFFATDINNNVSTNIINWNHLSSTENQNKWSVHIEKECLWQGWIYDYFCLCSSYKYIWKLSNTTCLIKWGEYLLRVESTD